MTQITPKRCPLSLNGELNPLTTSSVCPVTEPFIFKSNKLVVQEDNAIPFVSPHVTKR
jgi:hypothetical protein